VVDRRQRLEEAGLEREMHRNESMRNDRSAIRYATLGDLVCAAFDRAAEATTNPALLASLATRCIDVILEGLGRPDVKRMLVRTEAALVARRPRQLRLVTAPAPIR